MLYYFGNNFRKDFSILKTKTNSKGELESTKVDASSIDYNEKSIIILCGNNSKSLKKAEFYSQLCRSWLKNSKHNANISTYSIYYPNTQPLFNENPYFNLDYQGLATELFNKVIYKNNKILSEAEIKKNLSNVVFFGHSAGGLVMNELMKHFGKMLNDLNFSKASIKNIYNHIIFIAYAPYALVDSPIKTIYVAPIYDTIGSAKLVYKMALKNKGTVLSDPNVKILGDDKINARAYLSFLAKYKENMKNKDTLYFANKNSLMTTPNLLYFDGTKEDHNFAGAINYSFNNPNQTKAGRLTAQFLNKTFEYCLSIDREDFNIFDLYMDAINIKSSKNETTINI